jgi:hypothetical protein
MAGSKRAFVYTADSGTTYSINCDESNVEAVNGAAATAPTVGSPYVIPVRKLRRARYVNAATGTSRLVPVLTQAALAALPAIINFWVQSSGTAGSSLPFGLATTQGEKLSRYVGGDTGLNDGDIP